MTQIYTILFDLDGTLVDTAPDLMAAHNHVMKKFGHEEKEMSDIKSLAGKGAWVMMQRSFKKEIQDEKLKKEMTKEFLNFYSQNIDKGSVPIKGIFDFLKWAKSKNISMAVCTNKQEKLAIDLLKKLNMYDYFEYTAGSDTFAVVELGEKQIVARLNGNSKVLGGEKVKLTFDLSQTVFFDSETEDRIR